VSALQWLLLALLLSRDERTETLSSCRLDVVTGILIPCIAVVLFFLALAAAVLVILSWKRKKGK